MTTLENRPNTALLVVDVQNGVVEGAHLRDAVVANVGSLVDKARRERVPVVWVQHSDEQTARGSDAWRIVPDSPLIGGGSPVVEWIDDEGRIVSAAATIPAAGPVTLIRTTYELAHENWNGKNIFFRAARPQ